MGFVLVSCKATTEDSANSPLSFKSGVLSLSGDVTGRLFLAQWNGVAFVDMDQAQMAKLADDAEFLKVQKSLASAKITMSSSPANKVTVVDNIASGGRDMYDILVTPAGAVVGDVITVTISIKGIDVDISESFTVTIVS